ncbi:MAG TPA: chemotaxis protein CheW [Polyangiales bacterium]|nr:chemotaxis protein CheW [Polyangiales bacterium]
MGTREDELSALRATFFEEAAERLGEVEGLLLQLEQQPDDNELIAAIFRSIHSLKSGGGACELTELAQFAHVFENLLDQLRKGHMRARPSTLDVLLASTDVLSGLVDVARGSIPPLGEQEVAHVSQRIQGELASAGIASLPPPPPKIVSDDGFEGLVIWDDEPVVEAPLPSERPPPLASVAPAEPEPEQADTGALLSSMQLARLVDLSVELAVASSALTHAVSDPDALSADRLRDLVTQTQTHANEIESRLAEVRSDKSSAISEVVFLCVGEDCYFVPLASVERYFSPAPGALRKLPMLGEVLECEGRTLPVVRLRRVIGKGGDDPASVAVVLHTRVGQLAMLVDEVRTQTRVVVRPLYRNFGEASGLLGAALYAGTVVLVLDPDALARPRREPARAHSIQIL